METYCSAACARRDSMQALLGNETHYRRTHVQPRASGQDTAATDSNKPKRTKHTPAALTLKPDDRPPAPLPKSARHLPRNPKKDEPAPKVPPLRLDTAKAQSHAQQTPPTPPPKSARHLPQRARGGHVAVEDVPPVPAFPSAHANPSPQSSTGHSRPPTNGAVLHGRPAAAASSSCAVDRTLQRGYDVRYAEPVTQSSRLPSYHDERQEIRRSRSVPFLCRPLAPTSKLGRAYRQQAAIYASTSAQQAVPLSPPPAYTARPIYRSPQSHIQSDPRILVSPSGRAATDARSPGRSHQPSRSANHLQSRGNIYAAR